METLPTGLGLEPWQEVALRLGTAVLWGGILGINRDLHHKPAGVRVLSLVALGSATVALAAMTSLAVVGEPIPEAATRVMQGILSGIGFLGAGVIMRGSGPLEVHGLTTASSVWVAACLGIASGTGQWLIGTIAFALAMIILTVGERLEHAIADYVRDHQKKS